VATYGTIGDATSYYTARGTQAPWEAADDSVKTAKLQVATDWIDRHYGSKFPGSKVGGRSQVLQWPRVRAYDANGELIANDEIPVEVVNATYEAAYRELITPGSLSPDYTGSAAIKRELKKLDKLEKEVEYFDNAASAGNATPIFYAIDDILAPILTGAVLNKTSVSYIQRA